MTSDVRNDIGGLPGQGGTREDQLARRVAVLSASDYGLKRVEYLSTHSEDLL